MEVRLFSISGFSSQHCHWCCRCQHRHPHRDHIATRCTSSPTKDKMTARTNPVTRFFAFKPSLRFRSDKNIYGDRVWTILAFCNFWQAINFGIFLVVIWKPWGSQSWAPKTGEHAQVHQDDQTHLSMTMMSMMSMMSISKYIRMIKPTWAWPWCHYDDDDDLDGDVGWRWWRLWCWQLWWDIGMI